ncbi:MAG: hypothetical protein ABIT68_04850 [Sphingomicrobium sp.]
MRFSARLAAAALIASPSASSGAATVFTVPGWYLLYYSNGALKPNSGPYKNMSACRDSARLQHADAEEYGFNIDFECHYLNARMANDS